MVLTMSELKQEECRSVIRDASLYKILHTYL